MKERKGKCGEKENSFCQIMVCYMSIEISSMWYQKLKSKLDTLRKYPVFYPDSFLCFFWNHNIIIFLPWFSLWNPSHITFYPFYLINDLFSINCHCLNITIFTFACYSIYRDTYIYIYITYCFVYVCVEVERLSNR